LNPEDKILHVLKEKTLTNKEIAKSLKLKVKNVRKLTLKLRKLNIIKIEGKRGRENLYSYEELIDNRLHIESITEDKYFDGLLFTFISTSGIANYDQLVNFYSTLGITEDSVLFRLLYNLHKGVIEAFDVPTGFYSQILSILIKNFEKVKGAYPLTMSFLEAYIFFQPLGISNIENFIGRLKNIARDYPEFISIDSSENGEPANLIVFNKIFSKQIYFITSGAWCIPKNDDEITQKT